MIYPPSDGANCFSISSGGTWLPGGYDSEQAAKYAFRFPNHVLQELQDVANARGGDQNITMQDLKKKAKELKAKQSTVVNGVD